MAKRKSKAEVTEAMIDSLIEEWGEPIPRERCAELLKKHGSVDDAFAALMEEEATNLVNQMAAIVEKGFAEMRAAETPEQRQMREQAEVAQKQYRAKRADQKKRGLMDLNKAPWPKLKFGEFSWEGKITLKSWRGFQERQGAYGSRSSRKPSGGAVQLDLTPPGEDSEPIEPSAEQTAAFEFLMANEAKIASAILDSIFSNYGKWRKDADEFMLQDMPEISKPQDLKKLIGLNIVHVLNVAKAGQAYVGFEFGCEWEDEHGLGVMTHKGRVVATGQGDEAFVSWIAQKDGGKPVPKP